MRSVSFLQTKKVKNILIIFYEILKIKKNYMLKGKIRPNCFFLCLSPDGK